MVLLTIRRRIFFEINELFVLQAKFDKRELLTELAVKPKYFFNESHPEWEEPYHFPLLTWSEFKSLLARLETVKAKGRLTRKANAGSFITNSTGYYKEGYVHGSLEWGEVGIRGETGYGIRFFTVRYLRAQPKSGLARSGVLERMTMDAITVTIK